MSEITGEQLQKLCDEHGYQKVYDALEIEHKKTLELQAYFFSDPSTYKQAEKITQKILKQQQTLIVLKNQMKQSKVIKDG